ncbi:POTRA domain-containing protein [Cupriavidus sp. D39]|uniref:POTRA domain-containing protein n=1 Tax=Cupriavidus sp. D39 TaxID=2997877 RepID=UPI00226F3D74|nr:POTRA domain-containing protein [Cupriavidus sp. D39]MCY0858764.1 hypothetical protein [Cupriavidus sp. D39]
MEQQRQALMGRILDTASLAQLESDLTLALRRAGYLVAVAIVRPSERERFLKTGQLKVTLFAGEVGDIEIRNSSRVSTEHLRQVVTSALCPDASAACALTAAHLERALQLLRDTPGVQIGAPEFSAQGVGIGQTKLVVEVQQKDRLFSGFVSVDNGGVSATGHNRLGVTGTATNLFHGGT